MGKKIVIVGGVAGGASAAARLRRLDESAHIVLVERGSYISYANCGLPYYIGGVITDRSRLMVQTPEAMRQRFNLDIRTDSEVIGIDPDRKIVHIHSKERGSYEESYDQVILSPGARPLRPQLPGIDSPRIYTLRSIPDTDRIRQMITEDGISSAIVIGGGFIGVEMAENLREAGLAVTLVEGGPQLLSPLDSEMAGIVAKEMEQRGVELLMSRKVQSFRDVADGIEVHMVDGSFIQGNMVLLAIGVTPDTDFLRESGIERGPRGHILVNERLETSLGDVYAVGDAVAVRDYVNGAITAVPLAGPANKQGRIAADNICGLNRTYEGSQGTSILKVFDMTAASTGNNEKTLIREGIPYHVIYVHPSSHATYYPGAMPMTIKLLFNDEGIILGAQAVGHEGVDKRIDTLATVVRMRGTVTDLTELELAYAPPYSSAKDPVNMAGYTADNVLMGLVDVFVPQELQGRDPEHTILVDVRTELEHNNGHIPGSLLIPVDELRDRLQELDIEKEIWVYCQVGLRGYTASRILSQLGYKVRNLTGGYKSYQMFKYQPGQGDASSTNQTVKKEVAATSSAPVSAAHESFTHSMSGETSTNVAHADVVLDACGLSCPGPLIQVRQQMDQLSEGQVLHVIASDPGFYKDIRSWANMVQAELLQLNRLPGGRIEAYIQKGKGLEPNAELNRGASASGTSMVVFSGDLDKAIASFIIANGAAASGKKVTMFFTFWGLNVIRKSTKTPVVKNGISRMLGLMMPRGSRKLPLSRMNMLGAGPKMIRGVMNSQGILSLEQLIETAIQQGVELVACQMSMDVMGIKPEELIDGVRLGGVGYYLGQADQSGINLFI